MATSFSLEKGQVAIILGQEDGFMYADLVKYVDDFDEVSASRAEILAATIINYLIDSQTAYRC